MYSLSDTPNSVIKKIADRHKNLRKSMKISQEEMAKRSGVSLGSLKRFERTGQISLESLLKLAHVLNRLDEFNQVLLEKEDLNDIMNLFSDDVK
ncbi:helix-turn-helix transcriptional regulator [Flammeovirga sp. MY04]|uniref:helix-turn-helix domain-containing protein n=1 Tax=Flammeovirga sp. MY04 TaxID=1191459 RepID=UPI000826CEC0|nr:helix-turn-helix transcriptional regulator [Flammeovirga sp. MY04]ANQ51159.2 helix-turn-helix transcriptional regulator [Flammeovirga sp. MY04]